MSVPSNNPQLFAIDSNWPTSLQQAMLAILNTFALGLGMPVLRGQWNAGRDYYLRHIASDDGIAYMSTVSRATRGIRPIKNPSQWAPFPGGEKSFLVEAVITADLSRDSTVEAIVVVPSDAEEAEAGYVETDKTITVHGRYILEGDSVEEGERIVAMEVGDPRSRTYQAVVFNPKGFGSTKLWFDWANVDTSGNSLVIPTWLERYRYGRLVEREQVEDTVISGATC